MRSASSHLLLPRPVPVVLVGLYMLRFFLYNVSSRSGGRRSQRPRLFSAKRVQTSSIQTSSSGGLPFLQRHGNWSWCFSELGSRRPPRVEHSRLYSFFFSLHYCSRFTGEETILERGMNCTGSWSWGLSFLPLVPRPGRPLYATQPGTQECS